MRIETADKAQAKGWLCGAWDSDLDISVGFANRGMDASRADALRKERGYEDDR